MNHPTRRPAIHRLPLAGALLAPATAAAARPDRPPLTEPATLVLPPTPRFLASRRVPGVRYDSLQARHVLPDNPLVLTYLVHEGARPPLARRDHDPLPPRRTPIPDPPSATIALVPAELSAGKAALAGYGTQRGDEEIFGGMAAAH